MGKNDIKRFCRFLKELGLYRQFIKYTDKNYEFHRQENFKKYCLNVNYFNVLRYAFLWTGTPQGDAFWRRISNHWERNEKIDEAFKKELECLDISKNHH